MTTLIQVDLHESEKARPLGRPLYKTVIQALWQAGASGASVFRGEEGIDRYGRIQNIHSDYLSDSLPVSIHVVVDSDNDVGLLVESIEEMVADQDAAIFALPVMNAARTSASTVRRENMRKEDEPQTPAKILRVYMKEEDRYDDLPLYHALVLELQKHDSKWVGVQRALEGFGRDHVLRKNKLFSMSHQAPVMVEFTAAGADMDEILTDIQPLLQAASGPAIILAGEIYGG